MSSDLLSLVSQPLGRWRDEAEASLDEIEAWVNTLVSQSIEDSKITMEKCEVCKSRDGLEAHHIAGRKHDYRTVSLCSDCHQDLSRKQRAWGKEWGRQNQPEQVRQVFFLRGLIELLELKAIKTGNSNYCTLAMQYNEIIHKLPR